MVSATICDDGYDVLTSLDVELPVNPHGDLRSLIANANAPLIYHVIEPAA